MLLMVVSLSVGYLTGSQFNPKTATSTEFISKATTTTVTTTPQTPTSTLSQNTSSIGGLELKVGVNATSLKVGQRLGITISLYNNLPATLNITTSYNYAITGLPVAMWGPDCETGQTPEPVQFMLVRGNFSLAELQASVGNSTISPFGEFRCMEGGQVEHIAFQADSSIANLTGNYCIANCTPSQLGTLNLMSNFTVDGYWAYPINSSEADDVLSPVNNGCSPTPCGYTFVYPEVGPKAQQTFSAGWYTLVVADEWGQTVVLRFSVG